MLVTSLNRNVLPSNRTLGTVLSSVLENVIRILRNDAGLHNLRVGLLGFGGKGYLNKPHVYTVQGYLSKYLQHKTHLSNDIIRYSH